ncbi:MAG: diguanylate cyclase, partial [Oscillospiraceae bacterium]
DGTGRVAQFDKDDVEAGNKAVEDAMKTEDKEYEVEYRFIKKDGTLVWFLERGKILIDEKKKPIIQSVFIDIDDRKRLEQEIKIKDRSYEIAVQASDLIMFEYDVKMKKSKYYNIDIEEKSGKSIEELRETLGILNEDKKKIIDCYKKISEGVPVVEETIKRVNTEGAEEIYQLKLVAMYDEFKKPVRAVGIVKDITDKYILEREKAISDIMREDSILNFSVNVTKNIITDGANKWLGVINHTKNSPYIDCVMRGIQDVVHPEDIEIVKKGYSLENLKELNSKGIKTFRMEYRRLASDNRYTWVRNVATLVNDPLTGELIAEFRLEDIDLTKRAQLELIARSERDGLTGLYNVVTAQSLIQESLRICDISKKRSAFFIFDVDDFKGINDTLGHSIGDNVLAEIAAITKSLFRDMDVIGRLGGDEFIIFMENIRSNITAKKKAEELVKSLTRCRADNGRIVTFSVSIGVAFSDEVNNTYEKLYTNADLALYKAKENGRNQFCIYNSDGSFEYSDSYDSQKIYIDPITGEYNLEMFKIKANRLFRENPTKKYVVFISDIKNFKAINHTYGFETGDEVLRKYICYLRDAGRLAYTRANVDNFITIEEYEDKNEIIPNLYKKRESFDSLPEKLGIVASIKLSVGGYCTEGDNSSLSIDEMLDYANIACKQIPPSRETEFMLYDDKFINQMLEEQIFETKMHNSLENGEFLVYLQPKYDLKL